MLNIESEEHGVIVGSEVDDRGTVLDDTWVIAPGSFERRIELEYRKTYEMLVQKT